MHDRERKNEVEGAFAGVERHGRRGRDPRVDPVEEPRPFGAPPQARDHPRLYVDGDDPPLGPDKPRQLEGEEAHPGTGLERPHSRAHERLEQPGGLVDQPSYGAREERPHPPRADAVLSHLLLLRSARGFPLEFDARDRFRQCRAGEAR